MMLGVQFEAANDSLFNWPVQPCQKAGLSVGRSGSPPAERCSGRVMEGSQLCSSQHILMLSARMAISNQTIGSVLLDESFNLCGKQIHDIKFCHVSLFFFFYESNISSEKCFFKGALQSLVFGRIFAGSSLEGSLKKTVISFFVQFAASVAK